MTTLELANTQNGADKWQRLAPAAMIHFAVKFVMQFIKQGVQGLLPLGVVFLSAGEKRWFAIAMIGVGIILLLLVGTVLSYLKFRFRLAGDTFLIQQGVFKRKRLSLSYDRIQNVVFKQPIYFRPFNLVALGIESAGSSGEEVSLGGISRTMAEEIRTSIFEKRSSNASSTNSDVENAETIDIAPSDAEEIIRQPISELIRYGLSNNQIWIFAGLGASLTAQVDWEDYAVLTGLRDWIQAIADQGDAIAALIAVGGFLGFIALILSVSVAGAIISYYQYHLTRTDGRFHRTKGLFERQETSLPQSKVQSLMIKQGWPARLLNRYHLIMRQVGFSKPGSNTSSDSKFLVPSATKAFSRKFSAILYPNFSWSEDQLKQIDRAFTRRIVVWMILPICMIPAIALSIIFSPVALAILLVPLLLTPVIMLRRAQYGYATDGQHGIVRSGFIGHKLFLFPFYKVQTVKFWQTPGQRTKGLASLTIKLAGFSVEIPYMPLADAEAWRDQILHQVESRTDKWM